MIATSSSTIGQDVNNFFWDNTNHRLGIGTTAPTHRLEVDWQPGDSLAASFFGSNNVSNNVPAIIAQSGTSQAIQGLSSGSAATILGQNSSNGVAISGQGTTGAGVLGSSSSAPGVAGTSATGISGFFQSSSTSSTSSVLVSRSGGAAATGDLYEAQNSNGTPMAFIDYTGKLSISGTTTIAAANPAAAIDVQNGAMYSRSFNAGSSSAIDFSKGNVIYTTAAPSTISITNMLDGGSYTLVVVNSDGSTLPNTPQAGLTFKFLPSNTSTTSAKDTVYTMLRAGSNVYVSWITGF
jgi:hypothetical protein